MNIDEIIRREIWSMDENIQLLDKELINTNKLTPEDKQNIIDITGGDNYTYLIGMLYHIVLSPDAPAYNTQEKRNTTIKGNFLRDTFIELYEAFKNYNKNIFPIKNYDILLKNIHPLTMYGAMRIRINVINFLKKIPSLYSRNLIQDIRKPRDDREFQYQLEEEINRISGHLKMLKTLSPEKQKIIYSKIFSSKNKTFKDVADQLEKTEILFLNHQDAEEEVRNKVDNLEGDAKVLYDKKNIIVVDVKSSEAMKVLGCGSQWCFATGHDDVHWSEYTNDSHVNIIYNFNEEPDSKTRMVVLLPTGEVYNMYNEYMSGDYGIDGYDYLKSIGVQHITNSMHVNDGLIREFEDVGTQFDLQKFDTLRSYSQRVKYATQTLQRLGSGSSRTVFKLDNDNVLKLAKNAKGLEQNREECGLGQDNYFKFLVAKVEDCHNDDLWIISEFAKKITPKRFNELTGIDIRNLEIYLRNIDSRNRGGRDIFGMRPETKEQLDESEFVQDIHELMNSYDLLAGDLGVISSYGEVVRDGQPTIILIDYGITNNTYNTMYAKKRESVHEDYFDEPSEVDHVQDTQYGGLALRPQEVSENISDEIVSKEKLDKPIANVFSIGGLSESIENYRNAEDGVLNRVISYIESIGNFIKPKSGNDLSKLFRTYLISSQNIERILELSNNNIELYEKILKLQDIIKKFGLLKEDLVYSHVSDASPESDEYQIVSEQIDEDVQSDFVTTEANEMAIKVAKKLNMPTPNFIGEGGFGYAYQSGDKVIKITTDQSEAVESLKIKGKHNERIADIYGVYETDHITPEVERKIFVIILEKLNTGNAQQLFFELNKFFEDEFNETFRDIIEEYFYNPKNWEIKHEHIEYYLSDKPEVFDFLNQLIEIAKEAKAYGIESDEYTNKYNLGYKKDGKLGFFDVGFGDFYFSDEKPELLNVKEDGTSLYTDENGTVNERIVSFMPNSDTVEVKKNCQIGGNGDGTSDACNQGDIKNLNIKPLDESTITRKEDVDVFNYKSVISDSWRDIIEKGKDFYGVSFDLENNESTDEKKTFFFNKNLRKDQPIKYEINAELWMAGGDWEHPVMYFKIELTHNYSLTDFKYHDEKKFPWDINSSDSKHIMIPPVEVGNKYTENSESNSSRKYKAWEDDSIYDAGLDNKDIEITDADKKKAWKWLEEILEEGVNDRHYMLDESEKEKNIIKENMMMVEANISTLRDLPFKEDIEGMGGKLYSVGGAVRDEFLGKDSKDLDILITGVPFDHLEELLSQYGRVDAVGKSFGVLKFKSQGSTEEIDIAIPRTEHSTGEGGHKGFNVTSDHNLSIEKDLERRDFTINAIAKDVNGNLIDPFGGQKDLQNKIIRIVNPEAFSDDPLRMIRAVQFASRFAFTIEPNTMSQIKDNASRIKEIVPERILIEFDKIVKKGDVLYGAELLRETGLYEQIFGSSVSENQWDSNTLKKVKTMGEFIFMLAKQVIEDPAEFYITRLKGKLQTYNEIKALSIGSEKQINNPIENRLIAFDMYKKYPQSFDNEILSPNILKAIAELKSGKYPKNLKELTVNGNDLTSKGLSGKEIGDTLKKMLLNIYSDKIKNNKNELLNSLSNAAL